jgi:hypothetical protein
MQILIWTIDNPDPDLVKNRWREAYSDSVYLIIRTQIWIKIVGEMQILIRTI